MDFNKPKFLISHRLDITMPTLQGVDGINIKNAQCYSGLDWVRAQVSRLFHGYC